MTIPYITNKQQEIPRLLYRFRFINRLHTQSHLNHKGKRRINSWLKDLAEKKYITRIYDPRKFGENTKLAIYHIGLNGIRFLKAQDDCSPELIRKLYRDNHRSENFINQCLLLADCYLMLRNKSRKTSQGISYTVFTSSDFATEDSPFHFLSWLNVHIIFIKEQKNKPKKYYLLEAFEPTLPRHSIRKRIRTYLEFFYSNQWQDHIDSPFPIILFICPTKPFLIYAKRYTKKLLGEEQNPEDLRLMFATASEVKELGVNGEIWEEAEKK